MTSGDLNVLGTVRKETFQAFSKKSAKNLKSEKKSYLIYIFIIKSVSCLLSVVTHLLIPS
jgi:hypothetical protein